MSDVSQDVKQVSGAWAIGILVGIRLIFSDMTMLALGSAGRELANQ